MRKWGRKREADQEVQINVQQLKQAGFFSGKKSGTVSWHSRFTGYNYHFYVPYIFIDTIENILYGDFEDGRSEKDGVEGALEFKSLRIEAFDSRKKQWLYSDDLPVDQSISVRTTPCNYGKDRFWMSCPGLKGTRCLKRVGVLYWVDNRLACRTCHNLTYKTCHTPVNERGQGRFHSADKLDQMWDSVKKYSYRGKPTKRWLRVQKMHSEANAAVERIQVMVENGGKLPELEP